MIKEKRFSKLKKIATLLFIFILISNVFVSSYNSCVYGAINSLTNYNTNETTNKLEEDIKENFLIGTVGSFIYSVASIVEGLVAGIVGMLTGTNTFPWADKVVFNTMELLDINFINPATGSLFESNSGSTAIGKVVGNTYYTVFVIAVAFLSVCVGIMALRLIFASIASEKAKYKQAITQWLLAMVMLFLSHYLISFIFFVNEKMVEVASSMLNNSIETIEENKDYEALTIQTVSKEDKKKLVENMINDSNFGSFLSQYNPFKGAILNQWTFINNIKEFFKNKNGKIFLEDPYLDYAYYLITDRYYVSKELPTLYNSGGEFLDKFISAISFTSNAEKENLCDDIIFLKGIDGVTSVSEAKDKIDNYIKNNRGNKSYLKEILLSAWEKKHFGYTTVNNQDIFSSLGQFFKDSAWTYKKDDGGSIVGWKPGKNSIIGTLLYAIFIVQSIMLFIAYMKRFFYIIILALFAPLVIVFDFLTKIIS